MTAINKVESVQDLERKLKLAKEAENQAWIDEKTTKLKLNIGKCSATHTFQRRSKWINASVERIIGVEYSHGKHLYKIERAQYMESEGSRSFTYGSVTRSTDQYSPFKYELTDEQFAVIMADTEVDSKTFGDNLRRCLHQDNYISNGDYTSERCAMEYLDTVGTKYVDISEDKRAQELLVFKNCPYLVGHKIICVEECKLYVQAVIKDLRTSAAQWGGRISDREYHHIKEFKELITKHLS